MQSTQTILSLQGVTPTIVIRRVTTDEISWKAIREKKKKFELTGVFEPLGLSSTTHIPKVEGTLVTMNQFNSNDKHLIEMKSVICNNINRRIQMYVKEIERRLI